MSEITRFFSWDGNEFMHEDPDGEYVQYDDHLAEVERLRIDAERYQWLRSSQTHKSVGCSEFGTWRVLLNGPELDAAVDRGMLASANEGGRDE